MKIFFLASLLSLMFFTLNVYAVDVPPFILNDLKHEINEADYIPLDKQQREQLIQQISAQDKISFDELKKILLAKLHSTVGPFLEKNTQLTFRVTEKASSLDIRPAKISPTQKHAIHDLATYVKNRLGSGTYQKVNTEPLRSVVVGGEPDRLSHYISHIFPVGEYQVTKIPSLYEAWGISKYYIPTQGHMKEPTLLWIVPPSIRYVRHYTTLFSVAGETDSFAFVDQRSVQRFEMMAAANARRIQQEALLDYLVFGYDKVWLKEIQKHSHLSITKVQEINDLHLGARVKVIRIKDLQHGKTIQLGVFSSDQTVWGELASLHMKSFLNPFLKGVIFLGSAGSVDAKINPYDLSIPQTFFRPGQKIKTTNFISSLSENLKNSDNLTVHTHARHGNTFSPVEQNVSYLRSALEKGIQTLDVEQSLIAESIYEFNRLNKTNIQFGAVNLITDKPYAILEKQTTAHSLDILDYQRKQKAREKAVEISWAQILRTEKMMAGIQCIQLFL